MALDFSSVFYLNWLLDRLIHKDIAKVDLLLSQVSLRAEALSLQLQRKALLCARNIAISHAVVSVGLGGHEGDCDGNFTVWPDLSYQWFDFEDVVLEQKEIIFNGLSDGLIFPRQS